MYSQNLEVRISKLIKYNWETQIKSGLVIFPGNVSIFANKT